MNLVQMNILEEYAILQYSMIVVVVEIKSKVMKLKIMNSLCCIAPSQDWYYFSFETMFLDYNRLMCYSRLEIIYQNCIFRDFHGCSYYMTLGVIWNLPGAPVNFDYSICLKAEVF